jgi:hypothetical protein
MKRTILLILLFLGLPTLSHAATYYAGKGGSDSDSHSCASAQTNANGNRKLTLFGSSGLRSCLTAGHTGIATAGTYVEGCNGTSCVLAQGTASAPIVLKSITPQAAIIKPSSGYAINFATAGARYYTIQDFDIDGSSITSGITDLVAINGAVSHVTLTGNYIHHSRRTTISASGGATFLTMTNNEIAHAGWNRDPGSGHCNYLRMADSLFSGNHVHDCQGRGLNMNSSAGGTTINSKTIIEDNIFEANGITANDPTEGGSHGALVSTGTDIIVRRNVFNGNQDGLQVSGGCVKCLVYNNTIYDTNLTGLRANGNKGILANNIILGSGGSNLISSAGSMTLKSNRTTGTPTDIWTNPGSANFVLKTGSAAIDAGTASICISADISAGNCTTPAITLTNCVPTGSCDQGYAEKGLAAVPLTGQFLANNSCADTSTYANSCTPTTITYSAATKIEDSHSWIFDATTDKVLVGTTGMSAAQGTIAAWVRSDSFAATRYLWGHTSNSPSYADRIQVYTDTDGDLNVGMGSTHSSGLNLVRLVTGTWYYVALRWGAGVWNLSAGADVTDLVQVGAGSYTALTQLAATIAVGNNAGTNLEGWSGFIDRFETWNTQLTDAELVTNCEINGTCTAPPPPTFVDLNLSACANDAGTGLTLSCTIVSTPIDPTAECADIMGAVPTTTVTYGGVSKTIQNCSGTESSLVLIMAEPPLSGGTAIVITNMTPDPDDQVTATNNFSPPVSGGNKAMTHSWCRPDQIGALWQGAVEDATCRVSPLSSFELRVAIENTTGAPLSDFRTSLFCALNGGTFLRTTEAGFNAAKVKLTGLIAHRVSDQALIDASTAKLTLGGGITLADGRVRRLEAETHLLTIGDDQQAEQGWMVQFAGDLVPGTDTLVCRPYTNDGVPLDSYVASGVSLVVVPPEVVRRSVLVGH